MRNKPGAQVARLAKKCERCGAAVPSLRAGARFCSHECGLIGRRKHVYSEETRKKRSEAMTALNERPDVQAKLVAFRASDRCPIRQPESRRKLVENQRAKGFPNLKYDGSPTVPQKMLFDALPGSVMEFKIPKAGKGRSFRIDIALPSLKLAIEVDGLSHAKRAEREKDLRKEAALKDAGWILLRFRNEQILSDLLFVLAQIRRAVGPALMDKYLVVSQGAA
jgi:very-short-patch-repair endonuclease